ncbi:MAG: F0F1 ATP synthase subunit gamma [Acidobacteriota bacterium]|nr:F0F1 ATP synthase subunit gamma [Acidobacteriota bacterium]MDE3191882.1 F0F1 ATP synthase subunit gamma [Acidobacteriota bacterium]
MASLQDIRRRIASVRNTRKITKALELVAGARLRRAQSRIEEMRPYADRMQELMVGTARAASSFRNLPLMQRREEKKIGIVVFTGDRGLAGPFNGQVLRRAFQLEREQRSEGREVVWTVVGRKGGSTLRFRRYEVAAHWEGFVDKPTYHDAQAVAHKLAEMYIEQEVDRVVVVYNRFVSPLVQRVTVSDLLPIPEHVLEGGEEEKADGKDQALRGDFIYEPEPEEILERLLPVYLETEIYRALLESAASFLASQMAAMRSASSNASELIDRYTLQMNRARQAAITQEILEVVAGADALTA